MIETLWNQVMAYAPLLRQCTGKYGDFTLHRYCAYIAEISKQAYQKEPICPSGEISQAVKEYLAPLLGEHMAKAAAGQMQRQTLLLTANHHEAEFCVQSVQGNLLYAHVLELCGQGDGIVPVFANTTVNMANRNFPRGILVYRTKKGLLRVPVFPFRERNTLVAAAGSFTSQMIEAARETVNRNRMNGILAEQTARALDQILTQVYGDPAILGTQGYAKQAVLVNRLLGKRMQKDRGREFLYIEMEEIAKRLLQADLEKENSLPGKILFQESLRNQVLEALDKKSGCWELGGRRGTVFFWGVDRRKRRVSMQLEQEGSRWYLAGADMEGEILRYHYTKEHIRMLLAQGALVPGLFVTFLELYFLRGYAVAGGCFQSLYLDEMCGGLCKALAQQGGYQEEIRKLQDKRSFYLSGPMFLTGGERECYPLGTVELLEQGGISEAAIEQSLQITLRQSHKTGIYNFYPDLIRGSQQQKNWWNLLSRELAQEKEDFHLPVQE